RFGVAPDVLAGLDRPLDDLVVDVGYIHDVLEFPAFAEQMAAQYIFEDIGSEIANMYVVVHGWSTRVHSNSGTIHGGKIFETAGKCIGEFQHFERLINCRTTA